MLTEFGITSDADFFRGCCPTALTSSKVDYSRAVSKTSVPAHLMYLFLIKITRLPGNLLSRFAVSFLSTGRLSLVVMRASASFL